MRIIAGKHKGRRIGLDKDNSADIRPTSDFAREAIFNLLAHGRHGLNGHSFEGQRVLDVFCGSGALGLEALSRGAESATFVDQAREALATTRENAGLLQETETTDFVLADATKLGRPKKTYSLVFLDPPYFSGLLVPALKSLHAHGWLAEDALIVAEHDAKEKIDAPPPFSVVDERKYGRAVVKLMKISSAVE